MSRTISDYTFNSNECLGKGTLGNLHKGINKKTNQEVVLRLLQKQLLKDDKIMATALTEEMGIMQKIKHPKINPILEVVESQNYFYVVFPFCQSNLQQVLKKQRKLSEQETIKLINDLTDGFSELVKQGIIHRDLKPSNILFEKNSYIISDPGFAKTLENFRKDTKTKPQNFAYVAPQVFENKSKYTNKCDIWSLGMILYECIMGVLPFYAQNIDEHLKLCRSKKIEIPQGIVSADMKSFIEGCLVYQENKRLDWTQVLSHPLINQKLKEKSQEIAKSNKKYLMTQIRQKIIKKNLDFEELYDQMDTNKNGSLDIEEFSAFVLKIDKKLTQEDCSYVFSQIDKDRSGFISLDEFKLWLSGNNSRMAVFKIKQPKKQDPYQQNEYKSIHPNLSTPTLGQQFTQQPQQPTNQFNFQPPFPQQPQPIYQPPQQQPPQQQPTPQLMLSSTAIPNGAGYGKSEKLERTILQIRQQIKARQMDVLKLFQQYDIDRDSFLNFQEFQQLIWNINPQLTIEEMADLFKVFNLNNDEMISFVEFRLVTSMANEKKQQLPMQNYPPPQPNQNYPFQQPNQNPPFPIIPNQQPFYGNVPQYPPQQPQQPHQPQQVYPPPYNPGQKQDFNQHIQNKYPINGGVLTNNNNNNGKIRKSESSQLDILAKPTKKEKKKEREREREREREKEREKEKRKQSRSHSPQNNQKKNPQEDLSPPPLRPPKLASMDFQMPKESPKYQQQQNEGNKPQIKPSPRNEKQKQSEQPTVTYQLPYQKEHQNNDMLKSTSQYQSAKYLPDQMTFTVGSRYEHELTESTNMMHTSVIPANFNNRPYRKILDEKIDIYYYSRR